jgi:hypothetical protein
MVAMQGPRLAGRGNTVRFHFQVRTGTHVMVTEFADLSNSEDARVEAAKRIGLLLHAHAGKLWIDEDWQMDVTDATGLILFVITIIAARSAATSNTGVDPSRVRPPQLAASLSLHRPQPPFMIDGFRRRVIV